MKKNILTLLLILLMAMMIQAEDVDLGYDVKETGNIQKTIAFTGSGDRHLEVDTVFGGIILTGTDTDKVELKAVKTIMAKDKARIEKAKKEVTLDITSENGKIRVYVNGPFREQHKNRDWDKLYGYMVEYDFELRVPRNTSLKLKTATNGDIHVSNIAGRCEIKHANGEIGVKQLTGDFDVKTANGKIVMTGINGSGNAHTANGKVHITFTRNPKSDCSFHTINGKVDVTFQTRLAAEFRLETMHGEILSDFPFKYQELPLPKSKREKGKFVYKNDNKQAIRIGNGGPVIKMDTLNGNIIIAKGE